MTKYSKRKFFRFIFIVYRSDLSNLTIFKYFGNMQRVIRRIEETESQREHGFLNLNLVPFKSISSAINSYMRIGSRAFCKPCR